MLFLLHRDGKRICSGKPTKAWKRLQVRQALGRGIPLSMVSFYLASRSVIEAPVCQLSATLSRYLITEKGQQRHANSRKLLQIKSGFVALNSPSASDWAAKPAKNWIRRECLHRCVRKQDWGRSRLSQLPWRLPKKPYGKSGHCSASTWLLQPNSLKHGHCGYEACIIEEAN